MKKSILIIGGICLMAVGLGIFGVTLDYFKHKQYLENPQVNDIYTINLKKSAETKQQFTYFKIVEVNSESIVFVPSKYKYFGETGARANDFDEPDFFIDSARLTLTKAETAAMFEDRNLEQSIESIYRPSNNSQ